YSWRWVFYINVPFGILSAIGLMAYVRESDTHRTRFDFLGFGALSLAVGALHVFIVHTVTVRQPFISLRLFKDRNFATGNLLVFIVGVVLFATLALLPPLLQDLLGYPVLTSGI